jgi:uncharacterized membrane protein
MERDSWTSCLLPAALIAGLVVLLSLNLGPIEEQPMMGNALEEWLRVIVGYVAVAAELAAALVIGYGIIRALLSFVLTLRDARAAGAIRVSLGRTLILGLEFTIASDILRTAIAPSRQIIATLAAVVLLRTLLNYFLEREISQGE